MKDEEEGEVQRGRGAEGKRIMDNGELGMGEGTGDMDTRNS